MPVFECLIINPQGNREKHIKEAVLADDLFSVFASSGSLLLRYKQIKRNCFLKIKQTFGRSTIVTFTEMMARFTSAGLSLRDALTICLSMNVSKKFKNLCTEILTGLHNGKRLLQVLSAYPSDFSALYLSMIKIGESSGSISKVMLELSEYLHSINKMRQKILMMLVYPVSVIFLTLVGILVVVYYVLPQLESIVTVFDASQVSELEFRFSTIINSMYFYAIACTLLFLFVLIILVIRKSNQRFSYVIDRFIGRLPVLGGFMIMQDTLHFSFAVKMLTDAGMSFPSALSDSLELIRNQAYRKDIFEAANKLASGICLSEAFSGSNLMPIHLKNWLKIGEQTGDVSAVFSQIYSFYNSEVTVKTDTFFTFLEPALIVLIGGIVFLFVISFVLPVFSLLGGLL